MVDPRFHVRSGGPFTLDRLCEIGAAKLADPEQADRLISDVAALEDAGPDEISFLDNPKYVDAFSRSRAGACIIHADMVGSAPQGMALLLSAQPYLGYARIARAFYPGHAASGRIDPTAVVHESAVLDAAVEVCAGAVVAEGVRIGARTIIGPNAVIESNVEIGADCRIGANASLSHCLIGERCQLHAGVCIGSRGFGFAMSPEGYEDVPQLGRVIIEDGVEVGANSTIDRGAGPDTVIGAGTRIDNLVQIGHNVRLGRGCVIVAQSGISGSTQLEDFVIVAAQAGLTGHLKIGQGARIGAQSGVMRDVEPGSEVFGSPAKLKRDAFRELVALTKLAAKREKG